jgi:signal transduction histidine kinase
VIGVLIVVRAPDARSLEVDDLQAIERFSSEAVVAIELGEARNSERRLEIFEDRERIARDMHDHVIGRLFATGMSLQGITQSSDLVATQERINTAIDEIDQAIKDIRQAIFGVRSRTEPDRGTRGEILAIAADQQPALGFEPTVILNGPIDELPEPVTDVLLPILREALANSLKHAQASSIEITVKATPDEVRMTIEDDGIGWSGTAPTGTQTGNGLRNMQARVDSVRGTFTLDSKPGHGTRLHCIIPLA